MTRSKQEEPSLPTLGDASRVMGTWWHRSVPVATLLSVSVDPANGRARVEVALHSPEVDPWLLAATAARRAGLLFGPGAGHLRLDVYRCAFDHLDGPMTLLATHLEPIGSGFVAPAERGDAATPSSPELPLHAPPALWMQSVREALGGMYA